MPLPWPGRTEIDNRQQQQQQQQQQQVQQQQQQQFICTVLYKKKLQIEINEYMSDWAPELI